MDTIVELGGSTLPILFVILAGVVVLLAEQLGKMMSSSVKTQQSSGNEILELKDKLRRCAFKISQLQTDLKREQRRADQAAAYGRYYKNKYEQAIRPNTKG